MQNNEICFTKLKQIPFLKFIAIIFKCDIIITTSKPQKPYNSVHSRNFDILTDSPIFLTHILKLAYKKQKMTFFIKLFLIL